MGIKNRKKVRRILYYTEVRTQRPFQGASSTRDNGITFESLKLSIERKVTTATTNHGGHDEFFSKRCALSGPLRPLCPFQLTSSTRENGNTFESSELIS